MITRREILILGLGAPWLSACSGGDGDGGTSAVQAARVRPNASAAPSSVYGYKIVSWSRLADASGNSFPNADEVPPAADPGAAALVMGAANPRSMATAPVDGDQAYMPLGVQPGFSLGLWVKNRMARTLNFDVRVLNVSGEHDVLWHCAADPSDGWVFLTMSASQHVPHGWQFGSDAIAAVRIEQQDEAAEGPWQNGEALVFGDVYADVRSRSLFAISFDDGFDSQRHPDPPLIDSGPAYVSRTEGEVLVTAARHRLARGTALTFTDPAPAGLASRTTYWVRTVPDPIMFTLAADASLATPVLPSPFDGVAPYQFAGSLQRSGQQIVEDHGFKGTVFLVPAWLGSIGRFGYGGRPNQFMSAADAQAMHAQGWSIGSHSNSHPSNADNAGLRLLGPYGYFLSNPVDNLPSHYVVTWALDASHRRRAVHAAATSGVVTFENPHRFLVNMPIMFTDVAPTGFALGTVYYCSRIPSPITATFATDQGALLTLVSGDRDWDGVANYRYAGAADDDSAIYADIVAGAQGVAALGIATGGDYFALPQGSADEFVRSACRRAGFQWVRGASLHTHTIGVGRPSGGGVSNIDHTPGGWIAQSDSVQTDAAVSPSITEIRQYIDETVVQGACGCSYHHDVGGASVATLEAMCAYLRVQADAELIEVVTFDQMAQARKI